MTVQFVALLVCVLTAQAGVPGATQQAVGSAAESARISSGVTVPADYVIGTDDVLEIKFWKDKDLSADVVVRPDGKITLQLGDEIRAAGLTPDQLREAILVEARRFDKDATANVVVKQINSRKVFISGQVEKPGAYSITQPTTVIQLIAVAGGLKEYAKAKSILIVRNDPKGPLAYPFNYEEFIKGKRLSQNIVLLPGDTVVVP